MTCKYQHLSVGDRLTLNGEGACSVCGKSTKINRALVIYSGHEEIPMGGFCDVFIFVSPITCDQCGRHTTGVYDPCDGKFSGGIFEEAFRQVEVENVSID